MDTKFDGLTKLQLKEEKNNLLKEIKFKLKGYDRQIDLAFIQNEIGVMKYYCMILDRGNEALKFGTVKFDESEDKK